MGECLDVISGKSLLLPSNIGDESSTNDQYGFLLTLVNMTSILIVSNR